MAKQVEWTLGAQYDRKDIFEYWNNRNKYALFKKSIKIISKHPKIGRSFGRDNIRVTVVKDYLIVYEEMDDCIRILSIWDSRQDPDKLEKRL
jgi:plasmid stabilization system protein ParE